MAQEATPANAASDPESGGEQDPKDASNGQTPDAAGSAEPQTFDAAYVKSLRAEAAKSRKAKEAAEAALQERTDRDKTEAQRLADKAAENERKAAEAESKALRYEVAATRSLDLSAADFLSGQTREEIEASADKLAALLADKAKPRGAGFDGGARKTPDATKTPEQAHNDLLLAALGRSPNPPQ